MIRRLTGWPLWNPSHWWWGVFCWLNILATPGGSLEAEPLVAVGGTKTVTVSVVDDRTGEPVSDFTYCFAVLTTDVRRSDEPGPWQNVQSPQGEFPVQVPRSCQLQVTVRARGYCDFWGYEEITEAFVIRSQEEHPRVQMKIARGRTVRGVVRDAETDAPVARAKVRLYVFSAPMGASIRGRRRRRIGLASSSCWASCRGLTKCTSNIRATRTRMCGFRTRLRARRRAVTLDVRLRRVPGGRVSGRVTDREGSPLPGVEVSDADRASAESDAQGRFVLEYVQGATPVREFALTARKKGFFRGRRALPGSRGR